MKRQGIEETVEWEKSLKLAHECIRTKDQIAALEGECLKERTEWDDDLDRLRV